MATTEDQLEPGSIDESDVDAAGEGTALAAPHTPPSPRSRRERFNDSLRHFLRTQPLGVVSAAVILILLIAAVFAPVLATHDPSEIGRRTQLDSPSIEHLFGTDELGRDIFSRVLFGARISLLVATFTVVVSTILGTLLGAVSGYFGGLIDDVLQRIVDALMSIPVLLLALFIVALLGSSVRNVVIALAVIYTPRFSRIARGEMLRVRSADYVAAAEALGSKPWRVIRKHGLPNIVAPIIILASLTFGQAIVAEAALSFLGVGAPITEPSWGQMLSRGREYTRVAWWMVVFPGVALSLGVLALNLLGDALRDHLDPKLVR